MLFELIKLNELQYYINDCYEHWICSDFIEDFEKKITYVCETLLQFDFTEPEPHLLTFHNICIAMSSFYLETD